MAQRLADTDAGIVEAFEFMHRADLLGPDGCRLREALSQTTFIRELHALILAATARSQPQFVISVLQDRLDAVLASTEIVLPSDMI